MTSHYTLRRLIPFQPFHPSLLQQISSRGALKSFKDTVENMKAVPAEYDNRKGVIKTKLEGMLKLLRDAAGTRDDEAVSGSANGNVMESKTPDLGDVEEGGRKDVIPASLSPSRGGNNVSNEVAAVGFFLRRASP